MFKKLKSLFKCKHYRHHVRVKSYQPFSGEVEYRCFKCGKDIEYNEIRSK